MMIGHAVLFVAVVAAVGFCGTNGSSLHFKPVEVNGPQAERCCMPKQWSSYLSVLETINTDAPTILAMQMDFDRKKQVMLNYTGSFQTPQNKVVIDFAKEMLYSVSTKYPEYCFKMPISLPLMHCIPEDAEYLGSSYLGPKGPGQLPYDGWRIRHTSSSGIQMVSSLAMSKEGCVPLVEGVSYPQAPNQNQIFMFSGYQPGLTDPSAFDLPESCNK